MYIGKVIQKNYINVNIKGTQAASITNLYYTLESVNKKDPLHF